MASQTDNNIEFDEGYDTCKAEAFQAFKIWLVQSAVMIGLFLALGYYRTDDPLGFPLGVPSWYLFGGVLPALFFLVVVIRFALRMKEVPVND